MPIAYTLNDVARGELSAAKARVAVSEALKEVTPNSVGQIYASLRAWVWKALNARRRDQELREWFDLLKRAAHILERDYRLFAERIATLHDLVYESIAVSEALPVHDLLRRSHVRDVIRMVAEAPDGRVTRSDLGQRLNLKQANLTRVLTMVCTAGLFERNIMGRTAVYQLTRAGQDAATELQAERKRPEAAQVSRVKFTVAGTNYSLVETTVWTQLLSKLAVRERNDVHVHGSPRRLMPATGSKLHPSLALDPPDPKGLFTVSLPKSDGYGRESMIKHSLKQQKNRWKSKIRRTQRSSTQSRTLLETKRERYS